MTIYENQFESHAVHTAISQLEAALKKKVSKEISDDAIENLDRLRQASAFIRHRIEIASPLLTTSARLDQIHKSVQGCLHEVNQFQSNGNAGHLANASNQIDAGLSSAAAVITMEQPDPTVKAKDAIGFKSLANEVIDALREKADTVVEQVKKLELELSELEASSDEKKAKLNSLQSTMESKLQELESQFAAEQTERSTQFEEQLAEVKLNSDEKLASTFKEADEKLGVLAGKQSEAERIVNLIGNIGLTGNFKGAASREKLSADRLRMIALACFLGMVAVVLGTLFISVEQGFDPWLAIFRLGAGLTLIVPAAYAARESSRHRTLENRNRRAELELASIDAYLETLPKEKREEIKAELSDRYFGNTTEDQNQELGVNSESLASLLREAISALGKK